MRQSFSSASCAEGDSLCAFKTTLHCVVVKATAPFCALAGTGRFNKKGAPKSSLYRASKCRIISDTEVPILKNPAKKRGNDNVMPDLLLPECNRQDSP